MRPFLYPFAAGSLILSGAIFGFFYAWICSTMWGLDTLAPDVAIKAMNAMNASVRNGVFAPAFFGTTLVMAITAGLCFAAGMRRAGLAFALGAVIYLGGGQILTAQFNLPLNAALAAVVLPHPDAAAIWANYSAEWQYWNQMRTGFSGLALCCAGGGLWLLGRAGR